MAMVAPPMFVDTFVGITQARRSKKTNTKRGQNQADYVFPSSVS